MTSVECYRSTVTDLPDGGRPLDMVAAFTFAALAVTAVVFGGLTGALVWLFRVADDGAEWASADRRRLAARSFYLGAALAFLALWGLAASFAVDVETVAGVDALMLGVGGVAVAAVPLAVGMVLVFDAAMDA